MTESDQRSRSRTDPLWGLFESGPVDVWEWDLLAGRRSLGPMWSRLLAGQRPETEAAWARHVHPDDLGRVQSALAAHADQRRKDVLSTEYRVVDDRGEVCAWITERLRFVAWDADGRPTAAAGTHFDVSERRQAEAHRRALEVQLSRLQKTDGMARLAAGLAHDLNNLLMVIRTHAELGRDFTDCSPLVADELSEIISAVVSAAELTGQLLSFGRDHPRQRRRVQVGPLVEDVLKLVRGAFPRRIRVTGETLQDGLVNADPAQLRHVLTNLCLNARDAVGDSGRVRIAVDGAAVRGSQWMVITVTDDGQGISADLQARIFEPFYTTKSAGEGSGLGLMVVQSVVQQHGGFVEVESTPGEGTSMRVFLPALSDGTADVAPATLASEGDVARSVVLVADDDDRVRRLMARMLRAAGHEVVQAADGERALAILRAGVPRVDLAVLDLVMPGVDGREAHQELLRVRPDLPVLFVSGHTRTSTVGAFIGDGDLPYLRKPFTMDDLLAAVGKLLPEDADDEGDAP